MQNPDNQASAPSAREGKTASSALTLSLQEHHIGFFVPPEATLEGAIDLKFGALIYGTVIGDITCSAGSVVILAGGRVCGNIIADRVYVEGEVASPKGGRSTIQAHLLLAASSASKINADIRSRAFAIHKAKIWGRMEQIEDPLPGLNPAEAP
jgi:cytoskeletal protein CcmA (bactofilin family)